MKTKLFLFTVRSPAGIPPPAIFADLSGDSTPGFDFTPIQQFNISLSGGFTFSRTLVPGCPFVREPLLVSKPEFLYSV